MYSRWNGSAWVTTEICAAGAGIDATGVYSGGISLDHSDPSRLLASRQISGQWEVWRYTTVDNGATFSGEGLTAGSASKNIRPYYIESPGRLKAGWLAGTYTGYSEAFNMGLRGLR